MNPGLIDESWSAESRSCRNIVITKPPDFSAILCPIGADFHELLVGVLFVLRGSFDMEQPAFHEPGRPELFGSRVGSVEARSHRTGERLLESGLSRPDRRCPLPVSSNNRSGVSRSSRGELRHIRFRP